MHDRIGVLSGGLAVGALAYFITAAVFMGCERTPATRGSDKPPSHTDLIVLVGPPRSSPQWAGIAGGARRFVEKYPSLRLETTAPSDNTRAALRRAVREALSRKPRVICLYVADPRVARPAAEEIISDGTILVTMGSDSGARDVFGHVHVDLAGGAELLGAHLPQIAAGKRSYLLLHRHGTTPTDTHCYDRFMRKARSQYGITLLEERNAGDAERPPAELLRAMFARFRHAGLAVTLDYDPWLSTPPAELLGSNARFAALGAVPALWQYLRTGEAAALVGPLDGEIGSLAVGTALAAITESRKPGVVRFALSELVTRETLDDFASRYAEAAGLDLNELLSATASSRPAAPPDVKTEP